MSATLEGYLKPLTDALNDDALEDQLHASIQGITGLPGEAIRPRWQEEPPPELSHVTDWCSFGILTDTPDFDIEIQLDEAGEFARVTRNVELEFMASFYGPNAAKYGAMFRDGLHLRQNREVLRTQDIVLGYVGRLVNAPTLAHERWRSRQDLIVTFRRKVRRTYAIRSIESLGSVDLQVEK